MLKKINLLTLFSVIISVQTLAHDFWVDGYNSSTFKAHIGYGHDFPNPEKIAKDRVTLFESLNILDKNSKKTTLENKGENYQYITKKPLDDGSYILMGTYKTTYWTKTKNNKWKMGKTKEDVSDAISCDKVSKFAKSIINIGNNNDSFVTKAIGQKLEIIPLDNPINFKVGKPFKIKVLLDGKPAKTVKIKGTFGGFTKNQFALYGTTDLRGEIEITPLRGGKWILMTKSVKPLKDTKKCDNNYNSASLTFQIR